ncbi:MAG: coenzyme F420 hydrogenase/dehydrogenase beta subunit N-terminal domain-containing protein [Deltaproteobacteria bacterium]|nr:coenzyme F420 hydrogenase/dehydrogenase beta subunit N-terminal domain-containing protein [Deltaproteobacteria bacterium]
MRNGQKRLIDEVIERGLCVRCGACVGFCPYFSFFDGEVVVTDTCQADSEKCFQVCPVAVSQESSSWASQTEEGEGIGKAEDIVMARSKRPDILEQSQYGGVVSTLLAYALEAGRIQSAILTTQGHTFSPCGLEVWDNGGLPDAPGPDTPHRGPSRP